MSLSNRHRILAVRGMMLVLLVGGCNYSGNQANPGIKTPAAPKASHNLAPIRSNQWYSNLYVQFPTEPMYALPAAYQLTTNGLGVSLPIVSKSPDSIRAPYTTDLLIGFDSPFAKPHIEGVGDWSINLSMSTSRGQKLRFALAHGVPFTVLHPTAASLLFNCARPCQAFVDNTAPVRHGAAASAQAITLVIEGHAYLLAFDRNTPFYFSGTSLKVDSQQRVFLGMLDSRTHYKLFREVADTELLDTTATSTISGDELRTSYSLHTAGSTPLVALYPHQAQSLAAPMPVLGTYATIRGTLSLIRADGFTTVLPVKRPAINFAPLASVPSDLDAALRSDIANYMATGPPASKDYYLGVWFGRGSDLLLLARSLALADQEQRLLHYLEPLFATSLSYFTYDASQTSVIANYPEFGNEKLNDHNFHYGYYIRAGAVLSEADPKYLVQIRAPMTLMVNDLANRDRASEVFPYLRPFDVYEGHSWADGFAAFADGNNQESSSEAINAWYGVYLWSHVIRDSDLETEALYLYTTEVQSAKEYWFGVNGLYSLPYRHRIASIVWGGKVDFSTWFSGDPNAVYGIQLLPVTPGSSYLGQLPQFQAYIDDLVTSGGSLDGYWADLMLSWLSYYSPQQALDKARSLRAAELHGPRSLLLYMVYRGSQSYSRSAVASQSRAG